MTEIDLTDLRRVAERALTSSSDPFEAGGIKRQWESAVRPEVVLALIDRLDAAESAVLRMGPVIAEMGQRLTDLAIWNDLTRAEAKALRHDVDELKDDTDG